MAFFAGMNRHFQFCIQRMRLVAFLITDAIRVIKDCGGMDEEKEDMVRSPGRRLPEHIYSISPPVMIKGIRFRRVRRSIEWLGICVNSKSKVADRNRPAVIRSLLRKYRKRRRRASYRATVQYKIRLKKTASCSGPIDHGNLGYLQSPKNGGL